MAPIPLPNISQRELRHVKMSLIAAQDPPIPSDIAAAAALKAELVSQFRW